MDIVTAAHLVRLHVLYQQLEMKSSVLADLNKIYSYCELSELEESENVVGRIMKYKTKIEAVRKRNSSTKADNADDITLILVPVATVQSAKPHLPKLVQPVFKGDVTQCISLWDPHKSTVHKNSPL